MDSMLISSETQEAVPLLPIADAIRSTQAEEEERPNKYLYPEFAGLAGERYLLGLAEQFAPIALWRTWHAAVSFQAPGQRCYAGVGRIVERVGPQERKIYLDLQGLEHRGWLRMRRERMPFVAKDGSIVFYPVTVKDFTGFYETAHDYHLWLNDPEYIAPERDNIPLILADEQLAARLIKFEVYRRLLLCGKPGRKAIGTTGSDFHTHQLEQLAQKRTSVPKVNQYFNGPANGDSLYREIETTSPLTTNDSSRSGFAAHAVGATAIGNIPDTKPTPPYPSNTPETPRLDLGAAAAKAEKQAKASKKRKKHAPGEQPTPLPVFIDGHLQTISTQFADLAPNSSKTSVAWMYQEVRARGGDPYQFVEAFLLPAQEITKQWAWNIERRNPDGAKAKMRYFLSVLENAVDQWCQAYDADVTARASVQAADTAYQDEQATTSCATDGDEQCGQADQVKTPEPEQAEMVQLAETETRSVMMEPGDAEAQAALRIVVTMEASMEPESVELQEEPYEEWEIAVEDPTTGWSSESLADNWARRLREYLGRDAYNYMVLPTTGDRWGFILFTREPESEDEWTFVRTCEVRRCLGNEEVCVTPHQAFRVIRGGSVSSMYRERGTSTTPASPDETGA